MCPTISGEKHKLLFLHHNIATANSLVLYRGMLLNI